MVSVKRLLGTIGILALFLIPALAPNIQAQGHDPYVIRGIVYYEGQKITGVTVKVYYYAQECTYQADSDENGVYAILISSWAEGDSYRITALYQGQEFEGHYRFIKYEQGNQFREGDQIDIILGIHQTNQEFGLGLLALGIILVLIAFVWLIHDLIKQQGESKRNER